MNDSGIFEIFIPEESAILAPQASVSRIGYRYPAGIRGTSDGINSLASNLSNEYGMPDRYGNYRYNKLVQKTLPHVDYKWYRGNIKWRERRIVKRRYSQSGMISALINDYFIFKTENDRLNFILMYTQ